MQTGITTNSNTQEYASFFLSTKINESIVSQLIWDTFLAHLVKGTNKYSHKK